MLVRLPADHLLDIANGDNDSGDGKRDGTSDSIARDADMGPGDDLLQKIIMLATPDHILQTWVAGTSVHRRD